MAAAVVVTVEVAAGKPVFNLTSDPSLAEGFFVGCVQVVLEWLKAREREVDE